MRRTLLALTSAAVGVVMSFGGSVASAAAARSAPDGAGTQLAAPTLASRPDAPATRSHDLPSPLSDKQREARRTALELAARGRLDVHGLVARLAKRHYVELARQGEDSIWTVLGEFSDLPHNQIPEPDRSVDNTTIWAPDFNRAYYQRLLFDGTEGANSMRNYYIEQSSGRYAVNGDVTDWVPVPGTAASYGSNELPDSAAWTFIRDAVTAWAAGRSPEELNASLARFDVWDRYDYDGDGNFNEPDGYIDHFQTIHSGEGEEAGGGVLGADAIWSHRWYAFYNNIGTTGPTVGGTANLLGGINIPGTDYWIGDYTIEPENGGVGVFTHEFGHDLGLPDEYDVSGNAGGAENSTAFWTLMSSGSWGATGKPEDGIGDQPYHLNAWDKWFLGWLNYDVSRPGERAKSVTLGPAEYNTRQAQAEIVVLPDKQVTRDVGTAHSGSAFYYSGAANDLDTTMTRTVSVPADPASAELSAWVRYNIEEGYDYAYLAVDGTKVVTSLSNSQVVPEGIDGVSDGWVQLTADLSAYAGTDVALTVGYWTDGGVQGQDRTSPPGFAVDDIVLGSLADGAESGDGGWTFKSTVDGAGFHATTGTETASYFNAYVAENRQYVGYDANLDSGPYNFGFTDTRPDWVEHFPYQDGLLVWYYDSSYSDNNVGDHPGAGLILPVDAHPQVEHWADGSVMRGRIQAYDATFGRQPTTPVTLHKQGEPARIRAKLGVPTFDDRQTHYVATDAGDTLGHYQAGWLSVDHPHTGTRIGVVGVTPGGLMQIRVTPPPAVG